MGPAAILNILVTANTKAASAQLYKVQGQMEATEKKSHLLRNAALGVSGAIGVSLAAAAKTGYTELKQAQKASAQTAAVLKSTGGAAHVTAKHVDELATSLLRKSGIDDEAVKSGENLLLTFTKIRNENGRGNKIFDRATRAITDMATAMNHGVTPSAEQLSKTAIQVGKALQDPVKGATTLRRVGVQLTDQQQKQIAAFIKNGDTMKAQKIILHELNREFGGSAAAAGKTLPGQLDILRESYKNLAATGIAAVTPALQKIVPKITAFIQGMQDGTGAGGRFVDKLKEFGGTARKAFGNLKPAFGVLKSMFDLLSGSPALMTAALAGFAVYKSGVIGKLTSLKQSVVSLNPWTALAALTATGLAASQQTVTAWSSKVKQVFSGLRTTMSPQAIDNFAAHMDALGARGGPFGKDMQKAAAGIRSLNQPALDAQKAIDSLAHGVPADMSTILTSVRLNMKMIKREMKGNSADARDALAANFQAGVTAIRASMAAGLISTKQGLAKIAALFRKELALYGITGKQAGRYLQGQDTLTGKPTGGNSGKGFAPGGYIGMPGERGGDNVPIMVGRGEAILNRHQQGPVDAALRATYGIGLGDLFSRVRKPHFMAAGGFAGLQPGVTRAARAILGHFPGSSISSGFRTSMPLGHPDLHNYGEAVDIVGPNMNAMASWIDRTMGRGLAEGIHNPNLSIKGGRHVPSAFWGASTWAAHANHIHVGIIGKLRAAGFSSAQIKRVLASGVGGALGGVVQGGLDRVRGSANHALNGFANGGFVGAAGLAALASQAGFSKGAIPLAVAIALAESGGRKNAMNRNSDGSIDRGLWQINSVHGRLSTFNPLANARAAYAISHGGHDWKPWTTFRSGAYKRFLTRGYAVVGKVKSSRPFHLVASKGGTTGGLPGSGVFGGGTFENGSFMPGPSLPTFTGSGDTGTGEDPNQPLIDALNADAEAQKAAADALQAFRDEVKRQNDFATSVANVTSIQAVRALADVISGQIAGGAKSRALTASAGSTVRY